jgi:hypothetical protein
MWVIWFCNYPHNAKKSIFFYSSPLIILGLYARCFRCKYHHSKQKPLPSRHTLILQQEIREWEHILNHYRTVRFQFLTADYEDNSLLEYGAYTAPQSRCHPFPPFLPEDGSRASFRNIVFKVQKQDSSKCITIVKTLQNNRISSVMTALVLRKK